MPPYSMDFFAKVEQSTNKDVPVNTEMLVNVWVSRPTATKYFKALKDVRDELDGNYTGRNRKKEALRCAIKACMFAASGMGALMLAICDVVLEWPSSPAIISGIVFFSILLSCLFEVVYEEKMDGE